MQYNGSHTPRILCHDTRCIPATRSRVIRTDRRETGLGNQGETRAKIFFA